jgi:hypothetical protein
MKLTKPPPLGLVFDSNRVAVCECNYRAENDGVECRALRRSGRWQCPETPHGFCGRPVPKRLTRHYHDSTAPAITSADRAAAAKAAGVVTGQGPPFAACPRKFPAMTHNPSQKNSPWSRKERAGRRPATIVFAACAFGRVVGRLCAKYYRRASTIDCVPE